jgi:beta-lactamase regulating signal transducer with metallopeptidase domain/biotin carboxyl carrier protein
MTAVLEHLSDHGALLFLGATLFLGIGVVAVKLSRVPAHRQRLGELTVAAVLGWLVLAALPLPRLDLGPFGLRTPVGQAPREPPPGRWSEPRRVRIDGPASASIARQAPDGDPIVSDDRLGTSEKAHAGSPHVPDRREASSRSWARVSWSRALATWYVAGAAASLVWLAIGHVLLVRATWAAAAPDPWISDLCRSLPVPSSPRAVRIVVSPHCRRPIVFGLWRARIMLPRVLCTPGNTPQLRHVLAHELAHVRRGDAWGHALFDLAWPLLYCHPFYWWLRWDVQFARELIADDWAAALGGRESYVEELMKLARGPRGAVANLLGVLGVLRLRSQFFRRMTMLIDRENRLTTKPSRIWGLAALTGFALVLAVMVCLIGVRPLRANQPETPSTDEPARVDEASEPRVETPDADGPDYGYDAGGPDYDYGMPGAYAGSPDADEPADNARHIRAVLEGRKVLAPSCLVTLIQDVQVPARTEGVLVELGVRKGESVEKGELLARIDDTESRLRLESAEAAMEQVRVLEVKLEEARVEAEHANRAFARVQELREDVVAASEADSAKRASDRASLAVKAAELELKAVRELNRAHLRMAQNEVGLGRIGTPIGGTVIEVHRQVGEWIKRGDPICEVIRMDRLRVQGCLNVPGLDPADLAGDEVLIVVVTPGSHKPVARVPGKITFVSPLVQPGGGCEFWAEFENPKRKGHWIVGPGLQAIVYLEPERSRRRSRSDSEDPQRE